MNTEVHCWIRVSPYVLRDILDAGRFKSRFETPSIASYDDLDRRVQTDAAHFGYTSDLPVEKRPIYGYLCSQVDGNATHGHCILEGYGSAAIRLKDAMKARTTFCIGDSLFGQVKPEALLEAALPDNLDSIIPYVEAQYHGGVTVEDIAEVVFNLTRVPASIKMLIGDLRERGICSRIVLIED